MLFVDYLGQIIKSTTVSAAQAQAAQGKEFKWFFNELLINYLTNDFVCNTHYSKIFFTCVLS